MFFKIGSLKTFAIFTGKHLCWGIYSIKLQVFKPVTFLKRDSNTGVSFRYCEILKNSFFIEHLRWLLLIVLPQHSKVSWGVCSLISRLHVLLILIKKLHKTLTNNSLVHVTDQVLSCLNWLIRCFRFQNMFWKNISCFRFDGKRSIAQVTVISRVKRLSSLALCGWLRAFNLSGHDLENVKMPCKQKCLMEPMNRPANIYLFKINKRNTRKRCEICHWCRSSVFLVNFKHIPYLFLVFLWLTYNK